MLRITRPALESALQVSKRMYPKEFIALFKRSTEDCLLLTDLILTPLSEYREHSASFPLYLMPTFPEYAATFHSHPSHSAEPSKADLNLFSRHYRYHFISAYPFTEGSTRAYDKAGKKIEFVVVD